jgi:hypothetical protein
MVWGRQNQSEGADSIRPDRSGQLNKLEFVKSFDRWDSTRWNHWSVLILIVTNTLLFVTLWSVYKSLRLLLAKIQDHRVQRLGQSNVGGQCQCQCQYQQWQWQWIIVLSSGGFCSAKVFKSEYETWTTSCSTTCSCWCCWWCWAPPRKKKRATKPSRKGLIQFFSLLLVVD